MNVSDTEVTWSILKNSGYSRTNNITEVLTTFMRIVAEKYCLLFYLLNCSLALVVLSEQFYISNF